MTDSMRVAGGMATTLAEEPAQAFTGKLMRADEGAVRGWLFDHKSGFRIEFQGPRDPRGNGYLIVGKKVPA